MTARTLAAICPVCLKPIILGPAFALRLAAEDEVTVRLHLELHSLMEWAECVQGLRNQLHDRDELRRIPYWAMPQA